MTAALTAPASWRAVRALREASRDAEPGGLAGFGTLKEAGSGGRSGLENGALKGAGTGGRSGLENGALKEGASDGSAGFGNGALKGAGTGGRARLHLAGGRDARALGDADDLVPAGLEAAVVGFDGGADGAVRRGARALHAACSELLPGYSAATREPWRQSLLTAGCLDPHPRRAPTRRSAPPLVVEDVVQPSDVLCALWLARRCGLFSPGSPCGDGVGLRSACEIVPSFAPALAEERRAEVLEALRANAAWRAHRIARATA